MPIRTAALCVALFALPAPASEAPADLAPLEVRVTRSPLALADVAGSVTVLDGDDLRRGRAPASLAEALKTVPGLFVQNAGNFSQDARIALRGFGAQAAFGIRGVAIVVDGVPQTLPDGQAQVDSIDLAEVERIEILRGPASVLYGNAAGGVILITTRPAGDRAGATARQDLGEFRRRATRVALSGPVGPVGMRLTAGRFVQDGFRRHAEAEQYRAGLKLDWQPRSATRIDASAGYFEAPEELDPGSLTAQQARATPRAANPANLRFDAGESLEQWRSAVGLRHTFGAQRRHTLGLNGFAFLRDFANRLPFDGGGQVAFERRFAGVDARHEVELEAFDRPARLTGGIDYRVQRDLRERFDNLQGLRGDRVLFQRERVTSLGAYLQAGVEIADGWRLNVGVRFDEVRLDVNDRRPVDGDDSGARTWREASPGAGLTWRVRDDLSLWAGFGTAFQTPTTTELANPEAPADGGGFNRALGPETAHSAEFGLRWRPGLGFFEASVFRARIDDAIASIEVPEFSGTGRDFFANAGRSTRLGAELAAGVSLPAGFELEAGYTGSDFEFDRFTTPEGDFSGNRLPGVPRHRSHFALDYQGARGVDARLALVRVGEFYADNANEAENGARSELELQVGRTWRLGDWRVRGSVGVFNLLDQRYNDNVRVNAFGGRFFEPAPERHFFASLGIDWN